MAEVEQAFIVRLEASTGVTDVFSTRIYPDAAPQGARIPFLTISRVSMNHFHHFAAASGMQDGTIQLDCITDTKANQAAGREAIRQTLDGFRGDVTVGADTVTFKRLDLENELDDLFDPSDGEDERTYRSLMDFRIERAISVPTFP